MMLYQLVFAGAVGLAVQSEFYRRAFPPAGRFWCTGERPVEGYPWENLQDGRINIMLQSA